MESKLERGDHSEVAATATECPEEILILVVAGRDLLAVGGDHIGTDQVVARQAVRPCQISDPTTQRQPADTRGGDDPPGSRQTKGVGCVVEIPQVAPPPTRAVRSAGSTRTPRIGERSITDRVIPGAESGHAMTAAPHRHLYPLRWACSSAAMTSAASTQRTIAAGLRSCMALRTLRCWS